VDASAHKRGSWWKGSAVLEARSTGRVAAVGSTDVPRPFSAPFVEPRARCLPPPARSAPSAGPRAAPACSSPASLGGDDPDCCISRAAERASLRRLDRRSDGFRGSGRMRSWAAEGITISLWWRFERNIEEPHRHSRPRIAPRTRPIGAGCGRCASAGGPQVRE
jgi:hypothetical protein